MRATQTNAEVERRSKLAAAIVFVLSTPCGVMAAMLMWIALLEPGVLLAEGELFTGVEDSLFVQIFTRVFLVFMGLVFAVPQVGTLRRLMGYETFLPQAMSLLIGGVLLGSAAVGALAALVLGAWSTFGGIFGLFFVGTLFLKIAGANQAER